MVRVYEMMFIISPKIETDEEITAIIERLKGIIEDGGGNVANINKWGRRKLAYELKGFTEGLYVVMEFECESDVAKELERVVKLTDAILRHLIIKRDKE